MIPTKPLETNWQFFQRQLETSALPIALEACLMRAASASQSENPPVGGEAGEWEEFTGKEGNARKYRWLPGVEILHTAGHWGPISMSTCKGLTEQFMPDFIYRRKRPTVSAQEGPDYGRIALLAYNECKGGTKTSIEAAAKAVIEAYQKAHRQPTVPASAPEVQEDPSGFPAPASQPTEGEWGHFPAGTTVIQKGDVWDEPTVGGHGEPCPPEVFGLTNNPVSIKRRKPVEPSAGVEFTDADWKLKAETLEKAVEAKESVIKFAKTQRDEALAEVGAHKQALERLKASPWTRITADPESRPKIEDSDEDGRVAFMYSTGSVSTGPWNYLDNLPLSHLPIAWMQIPPLPAVVQEPDAFERWEKEKRIIWTNKSYRDTALVAWKAAKEDSTIAGQASVKEGKPQES